MAFRILYKRLFDVEVRQNYYLDRGADEFASLPSAAQEEQLGAVQARYDLRDDVTVRPTPETKRLMNGLDMVFKPTATGFVVGVAVEEVGADVYAPRRRLPASFRLRFAMHVEAPFFANYTNLPFAEPARSLYHFSTYATSERRTFPFLSVRPPLYRGDQTYGAGDLVRESGRPTNVALSLANANADDPFSGSPDTWVDLAGEGFVNRRDRLALMPDAATYQLGFPIAGASVVMTAEDGTEVDVTPPAVTAEPDALRSELPLDLSAVSVGRYQLRVEGLDASSDPVSVEEPVYVDPALVGAGAFAVVEVVHRAGNEQPEYDLVDAEDRLRQPRYVVHLLNRYTHWRYHFRTPPDPVPPSSDFDQVDDRQYVTRSAFPAAASFVNVSGTADDLFPNPSNRAIAPEADRTYSDVYIHN